MSNLASRLIALERAIPAPPPDPLPALLACRDRAIDETCARHGITVAAYWELHTATVSTGLISLRDDTDAWDPHPIVGEAEDTFHMRARVARLDLRAWHQATRRALREALEDIA